MAPPQEPKSATAVAPCWGKRGLAWECAAPGPPSHGLRRMSRPGLRREKPLNNHQTENHESKCKQRSFTYSPAHRSMLAPARAWVRLTNPFSASGTRDFQLFPAVVLKAYCATT